MVLYNFLFSYLPELIEHLSLVTLLIFGLGVGTQYLFHRFGHHARGNQFLIFLHVHNLTDGFIIGLAFLTSSALGLSTVFAVLLHDTAHKIIGFGFLREQGDIARKAATKTLLTFCTIALAAYVTYYTKPSAGFRELGEAFAIGSLGYIAYTLILETFVSKENGSRSKPKIIHLLLGAGLMFLIIKLLTSLSPELH